LLGEADRVLDPLRVERHDGASSNDWPSAEGRVSDKLRIAFCLPGLHRVVRGAEVAFESVAAALARRGDFDVTLFGSGSSRPGEPYRFVHADCRPREEFESWPKVPILRTDGHWEELTFLPGFLRRFRPRDFDFVVTCSYPLQSWAVRARRGLGKRPLHVFVTQNGDWPLYRKNSEYVLFDCEALVCTNPDYFDAHGKNYNAQLIPNGVDCSLFYPGAADRARFGLGESERVVLMVSALIPSKRVLEGVRAVAAAQGASLVIAGDGPLRDEVEATGRELLGGRFRRLRVARADMPTLYRSVNAFLHMSIDEPSANAYCEALASGLPIVTHDRRVTRWTLGEHARFVDTRDAGAVTLAVADALSDPGSAEARAAEAKRRFDWSSIADRYAVFLRDTLDRVAAG
jgi:glycosyltransferase involved in cell wall biosynthesis